MFKLNFKIALRNIWKNKTSSFINISGLAIGLASCLMLLLYVSYEFNYDKQTIDPSQTYVILVNNKNVNGEITGTIGASTNVMAPLIKSGYPGVIAASRIDALDKKLISNNEKVFKRNAYFADPDILKIYDYTFIAGNPLTALIAPNNVIITETTAKLLFGSTDVLGKRVRYDNKVDLKITGVIKDLQANTAVNFDFLMPWSLNESINNWIKEPSWGNFNYRSVVRMKPYTDLNVLNQSLKGMVKKHEPRTDVEVQLFPLKDLHLHDTFVKGISVGGKIEQVRLFMGLAVGILLIACINFMNMATAKSERRAKEVGIKKTIGATRSSLISQFLMESMVLTVLSTVMAIVLIELCLPLFNNLLSTQLEINYSNSVIWMGLTSVVLITGLLSGSYPAFYLSSFSPVQMLAKRKFKSGFLSVSLRQILVVGQFSFAVVLIIATAVIYKQIQFIKNRPIGYEASQLVQMPQEGQLYNKLDLFRDQLIKSGAVTSMFQSSGSISKQTSWFSGMKWPGSSEADKKVEFTQLAATYGFISTTGVKLIDGRDFSKQFASDTAALLLSNTAVKRMNLINPVGQTILYHGNKFKVVGVFADFILGSPAAKEKPLVVAFIQGWGGTITMRLNSANPISSNLATIEAITKEINPAYPVELTFVDQLYAEKLQSERVLGILSNLFGGLAIIISCLGLFGLAAYSAEQRTKEIGVRKVLGASMASLIQLLSFSFLKMVFIAIIIAVPVSSYLMDNWLKSFEFHTTVSLVMIVMAAAGTIMIALLTVSFQAYKAAKANPVNSLKYE